MEEERAKRPHVGLYIYPTTRAKLNMLRADLAYARGEHISQDDVINIALDHFLQTSGEVSKREYA
jgi:hypothetical protein